MIKWTKEEIEVRLENYNLDDSTFDIQATQIRTTYITQRPLTDDAMVNKAYRLLKREQLDWAMQQIGRVLYYYIRFRYIHGESVEVIALISGKSEDYVKECIKEGIHYITKYLNKRQKKNPLTA